MIARRLRPEDELQMAVCKLLRHALPFGAVYFHIPNGGKRSLTEAARFKRMGVTAGMPDLGVLHEGRIAWLELKVAKGRVSDVQARAHERLRIAGCPVSICKSIDDVIAALAEAGVPLRITAGGAG
jgi:hypothetical protein